MTEEKKTEFEVLLQRIADEIEIFNDKLSDFPDIDGYFSEKHDIFVHFDKCDRCGQETLIINYNYSKRPKYNTRLCTRCCPKTIQEGLELRKQKIDFFSYIKSV